MLTIRLLGFLVASSKNNLGQPTVNDEDHRQQLKIAILMRNDLRKKSGNTRRPRKA